LFLGGFVGRGVLTIPRVGRGVSVGRGVLFFGGFVGFGVLFFGGLVGFGVLFFGGFVGFGVFGAFH